MTPNTPAGGAVAWEPCPFCGCDHADNATNAPFPSRAFGARYWTARCGNPSCGADVEGETEQDALNRWNRRPATVSVDAVRGLVSEMMKEAAGAPGTVWATDALHWARRLEALTREATK